MTDVRAAVAAALSGDTVIVPAGSATWTGQLVMTKGIQLLGAGIGQTVIASGYNAPIPQNLDGSNFLIVYAPANPALNEVFRFSGFTLNLNKKCLGVGLFNDTITAINRVRFDHNRITDAYATDLLFLVFGSVYGVADHNELVNGMTRFQGLDERSWNNFVFNFGSADNFYVEDNHFSSPDTMFFYGEAGGRYCARFNSFDSVGSTNGMYPFADLHGNQPNAHMAEMGAEIYGNAIDGGSKGVNIIDHRGGKALVYNNSVTTSASDQSVYIQAREEYNDNIGLPLYPANSPLNGQPQHVSDSYYWNNLHGNSLSGASISGTVDYGGSVGIVPQANRDFWSQGPSFDGTSGVGVGPLASRPATCTTGVGYWATDTQTLYKATATNVWTAYYKPYIYPHPLTSPLVLTSPNGGESWSLGSTQSITWMATGYAGPVTLTLLRDGASVMDIATPQASASSFSWALPKSLAPGAAYTVRIVGGTNQDVSDTPFSIVDQPWLSASKRALSFGAVANGISSSAADVVLTNTGTGTIQWSAARSADWISITPASGAGTGVLKVGIARTNLSQGVYAGTVSVTDPNAANSPLTIAVSLTVVAAGGDAAPFGSFDTPATGSAVGSSVATTGWALDQIGVASVKIYRDPVAGEKGTRIYIGDAVFLQGARPDVETAYPSYPGNDRAGWGYMLLTNFFPNSGNGTFALSSYAVDSGGHEVLLGRKTIVCDNAHATKPFGALDAPAMGATVTGGVLGNAGWALTPKPKSIPFDGSTIIVWVDGLPLGHPTYNGYRSDIAALFPGYANSGGAGGGCAINTAVFANGMHSISWAVSDSAGAADGIGSRFFNVLNTVSGQAAFNVIAESAGGGSGTGIVSASSVVDSPLAMTGPIFVRRGYDPTSLAEPVYPGLKGSGLTVPVAELERVAVYLDADSAFESLSDLKARGRKLRAGVPARYSAYLAVGSELRPLPIGATFDGERGVLYWQPGPGFVGDYKFVILTNESNGFRTKIPITVRIGSR